MAGLPVGFVSNFWERITGQQQRSGAGGEEGGVGRDLAVPYSSVLDEKQIPLFFSSLLLSLTASSKQPYLNYILYLLSIFLFPFHSFIPEAV